MDQFERYDPDDFDLLGLPFAVPAGSDLRLMVPQRDVVSAAVDALGRGTALVLVTGEAGSGRTIVAAALADALRGHGLVVDEIAQLGGIAGTALLHRVAPLLRIAPERLSQAIDAILPDTAGAAVPDQAVPGLPVPGLAISGRRTAASHGAGLGAREPEEPEAQDTSGLGMLRAAAQAGVRLAEGAQAEAALAVVVDDAGTWPTESLLVLLSLARLRRDDAPLLQAVLVGDAALERRLAAMRGAGQGSGPSAPVSLRIPPLTLRQGEEYLAHRFAVAGGSLERTVSAAAAREIVVRCAGNPGRIDQLAEDCLVLAASQRRRMVTPAVVRAACEPSARHGARRLGPVVCALLGATGGVLAAGAGLGLAVHAWTPAIPASSDGTPLGHVVAPLPTATPAAPGASLFAGAGRFGTPPSIDAAPATQGVADRPEGSPGFGQAGPHPAAPSTPSPVPAVHTALAPVPVVPPPAPVPFLDPPAALRFAAPERADVTAQPLLLDPVPVAPALAAPDALPRVDVPLLALAPPVVVQAEGSAEVADLEVPALSLPAAPPVQPRIAQASGTSAPGTSAPQAVGEVAQAGTAQAGVAQADAPASRGEAPPPGEPHVSPLPAAALPAVARSPQAGVPQAGVPMAVPHYDGAVMMHSARVRDTASVLLRRVWGRDDAVAEALFRSLNPLIDAQGPWPAGTTVAVPQRTRGARGDTAPLARPRVEQVKLPTPPSVPYLRPDAIHDNPAGQVQSSVPYFCRSISPQNGAEAAYTRQVCGR